MDHRMDHRMDRMTHPHPHRPAAGTRRPWAVLAIAALLALAATGLAQDALVGRFGDGRLTITVQGGGGQYGGQIVLEGRTYPFQAQGSPQRIDGSFEAGADRFPFSAGLQGDTLVLVSGNASYTLARQAGEPGPAAAARSIGPWWRVTYESAVASHPGTNSGPDARSTGGSGVDQYDVIHLDDTLCVMVRTGFVFGLMGDRSLSPNLALSGTVVGRDGSCPQVWTPPARLAAYEAPPGLTQQVARGPFQLPGGGASFDALTVREETAETRFSSAWDLASGLLLMSTAGTGARQAPAPGPTSSAVQTLAGARRLELPWDAFAPLPAHIQSLQELTYRVRMTHSLAGVADPLPPQTQVSEVRLAVAERHPTLLLLRDPSQGGADAAYALLAGNGSFFLPPEAIARLRPGQLLDQDPITGARLVVERVDASGVVLHEQNATFESRATFDPRSGLLTASAITIHDGVSIQAVELQLVAQR